MSAGDRSLLGAVRVDLHRLHEAWLGLAFPRRRGGPHPVTGHWRPQAAGARLAFRLWSLLGGLAVAVGYPVVLVGLAIRAAARRFDRLAELLGALGVLALTAVLWGVVTAVARLRFSVDGFLAVGAAAAVASTAAGLAVLVRRLGGRTSTVLLAYPLGVTALFLPPVVAALYSPALADTVFPGSESLAIWLLDSVLSVGGVAAAIRASFDLVGVAYVGMWVALSVPVGWLLGGLVGLANVARPSSEPSSAGL